jgi:hypothetical protein
MYGARNYNGWMLSLVPGFVASSVTHARHSEFTKRDFRSAPICCVSAVPGTLLFQDPRAAGTRIAVISLVVPDICRSVHNITVAFQSHF